MLHALICIYSYGVQGKTPGGEPTLAGAADGRKAERNYLCEGYKLFFKTFTDWLKADIRGQTR